MAGFDGEGLGVNHGLGRHGVFFEFFEWDGSKAEANRRKHGIRFETAAQIFKGPVAVRPQREGGEDRWCCIGMAEAHEIFVVVVEREAGCRIVPARKAARE